MWRKNWLLDERGCKNWVQETAVSKKGVVVDVAPGRGLKGVEQETAASLEEDAKVCCKNSLLGRKVGQQK
jgi:16S rRNA A1518/A1519 N6-dimethyltransferase RsmA/KsgA/DIM1 with predicted DNA glycosylase/AP lyase activity